MIRSLRLSPVASLSSFVNEGELVAFNVGHDGSVYIVVAQKPLDYRIEQTGASFAKTISDWPQTYRVVGLRGSVPILDVIVEGERFNIHHVQPLLDELLLVCGRSHYKGRGDAEKNGRVYNRSGEFVRELLLGDGINEVQTTSSGVIWTSFSDEGIFGNLGWRNPIGASGLIAWDAAGEKLYEFAPIGLKPMSDCYALNVESEANTWCYFYTEFPLVLLHGRTIQSIWQKPLGGSDAFAVARGHAFFRGGYQDRDIYHLFRLGANGKVKLAYEVELQDNGGEKLIANRVVGRANAIHFVSGANLYRVDVQAAIAA